MEFLRKSCQDKLPKSTPFSRKKRGDWGGGLTSAGGAGELVAGEETGVHVGEGDEHEERVVDVLLDETDSVVAEELGESLVLVRLRQQRVIEVQIALLDIGEVHVELCKEKKHRFSYLIRYFSSSTRLSFNLNMQMRTGFCTHTNHALCMQEKHETIPASFEGNLGVLFFFLDKVQFEHKHANSDCISAQINIMYIIHFRKPNRCKNSFFFYGQIWGDSTFWYKT